VPDADKDGVSDAADLCPDSPAGSSVNALGCPPITGIVLEGVTFTSGTAVLTPESQKKLDQAAVILKQAPHVNIEVAGYTDSVGDAKRNLNLSVQRSQAVVNYLTSKALPPHS
jgi:outer membrane protein OmpA-like peptidoglycan-associated protein